MKILLLLGVTIIASLSNAIIAPPERRALHYGKNITELILEEEYPVQNITVETQDGYLLDIIRIPGPRNYSKEFTDARKNHQRVQTNKPVVLLMHGLLGSADDFVVGGYSRGLAYKLADNGYDVFLGNARGSRYARKHTRLNPDRDSHFWQFCWDHMGKLDLPVIIDKILETSGQERLHYIGHNQGSTIFYVLASQKPKYNSKIDKMIALAPLVYLKHANHSLMSLIAENRNYPTWIMKNLGRNEFSPSHSVKSEGGQQQCKSKHIDDEICNSIYFLVNGYSEHFNKTLAHQIVHSHPDGASTRQLMHYAQLITSGRFELYDGDDDDDHSSSSSKENMMMTNDDDSDSDDSNSSDEEEYELSKVTTDNYIFYVPDDDWYNEEDINTLASRLPNVEKKVKFPNYSSNVDLLIAEDAHHHVHRHILQCLDDASSKDMQRMEEETRNKQQEMRYKFI